MRLNTWGKFWLKPSECTASVSVTQYNAMHVGLLDMNRVLPWPLRELSVDFHIHLHLGVPRGHLSVSLTWAPWGPGPQHCAAAGLGGALGWSSQTAHCVGSEEGEDGPCCILMPGIKLWAAPAKPFFRRAACPAIVFTQSTSPYPDNIHRDAPRLY